jgi:hypothetical protein
MNQTKPNQTKQMTHTHTESPWHLGTRAGNPAIYGKDGAEIAEILHVLNDEWRENARLIAAAPELLAALQLVYSNAGESPEWIRARIGSVIAKAEGKA